MKEDNMKCENYRRYVELKNNSLTVKLVPCGSCKRCKKPAEIVDLVDSESEDSLYTSWLKGRYTHIREVVHLD